MTGKVIAANWKMNGSVAMAAALVPKVASYAASAGSRSEIVLCPPATLLAEVGRLMQGSFLALGAQDVSAHASGAYTGEISAGMLKEAGCRYVIVGHSERRQYHAESDALVKAKAEAALAAGLTPILCIGETLEERESGKAFEVVSAQLKRSLPTSHQPPTANFLLAYEPVWAIGSGKVPSSADIEAMHAHIGASAGAGAKILYGGSVNAGNAREILSIPGVDGVLVGGASLKAEEFCSIIECGV